MTIRITGMNSGLDTETIINELASARSQKVTSLQKAQTKLSWKIDAWQSLNTKIYNFYANTLSDMRFTGNYAKKTTKVSNSNAVSVLTGGTAMNGTQKLNITQLAKTAYLTGGKITNAENADKSVTADTTLKELGFTGDTAKFNLTIGGETKELEFASDAKISDVVSSLKDAGLNAGFDATNGRFFISAAKSGEASDFSLEVADDVSKTALEALGLSTDDTLANHATKIDGKDAKIHLNGAEFTFDSNTFEINGLTYTINQVTDPDGKDGDDTAINVTTENDTSGIYDMLKKFIKEYNELIKEVDTLYNADSASKYEPLTSEEKDAMSDSEVEEWEKKIKDSLLRRDGTLNTVSSAMKEIMLGGYEVTDKNGQTSKMYLGNFGIATLSYFASADNEKGVFHIDGDDDDTNTKANEDLLKKAITDDPDLVTNFFTKLSNTLYDKLTELMGRTDYSSAYKLYNDKQMATELSDYETKIKEAQEKLNDYTDKWYKKFSNMEVALSKLNSKTNAISNMLG
jgi:flagellar hook-associated protein 2